MSPRPEIYKDATFRLNEPKIDDLGDIVGRDGFDEEITGEQGQDGLGLGDRQRTAGTLVRPQVEPHLGDRLFCAIEDVLRVGAPSVGVERLRLREQCWVQQDAYKIKKIFFF